VDIIVLQSKNMRLNVSKTLIVQIVVLRDSISCWVVIFYA
jgi:hypothetical protein